MRPRLALLGLLAWLAAAQAAAQEPPSVVVVAPDAIREDLFEALAVELATRGARVSPSRDPRAGEFVVRVGRTETGLGMEVTARETGRVLRIPRLDAVDGRSLAVVAASLLDEAREPRPIRPVEPSRLAGALTAPLAQAPPPPRPFFAELPPTGSEPEPRVVAEHGAMFGVGLGGAFQFNGGDYAAGGGFTTRLLVGYRFRNLFRAAFSLQGAFATQEDTFVEFQPTLVPCLEGSGTIELSPVSLHLGLKACLFVQQWRHFQPDPFEPFLGPNGVDVGAGAGGFVGSSVYVADAIALWLRADLTIVVPEAIDGFDGFSAPREWSLLGEIALALVIE